MLPTRTLDADPQTFMMYSIPPTWSKTVHGHDSLDMPLNECKAYCPEHDQGGGMSPFCSSISNLKSMRNEDLGSSGCR